MLRPRVKLALCNTLWQQIKRWPNRHKSQLKINLNFNFNLNKRTQKPNANAAAAAAAALKASTEWCCCFCCLCCCCVDNFTCRSCDYSCAACAFVCVSWCACHWQVPARAPPVGMSCPLWAYAFVYVCVRVCVCGCVCMHIAHTGKLTHKWLNRTCSALWKLLEINWNPIRVK